MPSFNSATAFFFDRLCQQGGFPKVTTRPLLDPVDEKPNTTQLWKWWFGGQEGLIHWQIHLQVQIPNTNTKYDTGQVGVVWRPERLNHLAPSYLSTCLPPLPLKLDIPGFLNTQCCFVRFIFLLSMSQESRNRALDTV